MTIPFLSPVSRGGGHVTQHWRTDVGRNPLVGGASEKGFLPNKKGPWKVMSYLIFPSSFFQTGSILDAMLNNSHDPEEE